MKKFSYLFLLIILSCTPTKEKKTSDAENYFYPGQTWYDTDSNVIHAHACGILKMDDIYYMYGQDQRHGHHNKTGVCCYSSKDLYNWKFEGIVLPSSATPELYQQDGSVLERPKVIYNEKTGKYVMWMHLDANQYSTAEAGVAISDAPTGSFKFLKTFRPIAYDYGYGRLDGGEYAKTKKELERIEQVDEKGKGNTYRDMNLFVDDDGTGYVIYASETNVTTYISKLSDDYTDIARPVEEGVTWSRAIIDKSREAPAPFKYKNKYYMITSGLTGWAPNPAAYHTAGNMLGPWETHPNPCIGPDADITFEGQSTFVLHAPGKDENCFIFMADIWNSNELQHSKLMWLPFYIKEDGSFKIRFLEKWNLDIFDNCEAIPATPENLTNNNFVLQWDEAENAVFYQVFEDDKLIGQTADTHFELPEYLAGHKHTYHIIASTLFDKNSDNSKAINISWEQPTDCILSDKKYDNYKQGWGSLAVNKSLHGSPIKIGDKEFEKGFGSHAPGKIVYQLNGKYSNFSVHVGLDAYAYNRGGATAEFIIKGDGKELFNSGLMTENEEAKKAEVSVKGIQKLELICTNGGDGTHYDHVDWAEPSLEK